MGSGHVLRLEPRHFEEVAQGGEPILTRDAGEIRGEGGKVGCGGGALVWPVLVRPLRHNRSTPIGYRNSVHLRNAGEQFCILRLFPTSTTATRRFPGSGKAGLTGLGRLSMFRAAIEGGRPELLVGAVGNPSETPAKQAKSTLA